MCDNSQKFSLVIGKSIRCIIKGLPNLCDLFLLNGDSLDNWQVEELYPNGRKYTDLISM